MREHRTHLQSVLSIAGSIRIELFLTNLHQFGQKNKSEVQVGCMPERCGSFSAVIMAPRLCELRTQCQFY